MDFERIRRHQGKHVLVVDDDRSVREMFRAALRLAGYDVRIAFDGTSALAQIEQHVPDVVVLDLDLPSLNGMAVHGELIAREHTRDVRVVVVTGTAWTSPYPVHAMLRKPISPDRLVDAVTSATESAASGPSYS